MVDYKKYIQVLEILNSDNRIFKDNICVGFKNGDTEMKQPSKEEIASAICELFDEKQKQFINSPFSYGPSIPLDLNRATCVSTDNAECDMSPNDFQSCGCPKGVTCPGY